MSIVAVVVVHGHEAVDNVNRDWEDDGGVVFSRDTVQCLKISQLKENLLQNSSIDS